MYNPVITEQLLNLNINYKGNVGIKIWTLINFNLDGILAAFFF